MIIVGNDRLEVESELLAGGFDCPACSGVLRPWGSARRRVLRCAAGELWRRPRRGRCISCGGTHVLLAADSLVRRRDETVVIGAALVMKARFWPSDSRRHVGVATVNGAGLAT